MLRIEIKKSNIIVRGSLIIALLSFAGLVLPKLGAWPGQTPSKRHLTISDALTIKTLRFSPQYGISPDGEHIAYEVRDGYHINAKVRTRYHLVPAGFYVYVKSTQTERPVPITNGRENSWTPSWSPDGRRLAFYVWHNDQICIAIWDLASDKTTYYELAYLMGQGSLDWNPQGDKIFYFPSNSPEISPIWPYPESEKLIIRATWEEDPYEKRYINSQKRQLWALDIRTGQAIGILTEETNILSHALSPDGKKMAVAILTRNPVLTHLVPSFVKLVVLSLDGGQRDPVFTDRIYTTPYSWSPDSRSIAYTDEGRLWVYDLKEKKQTPVSRKDMAISGAPLWHPDGGQIMCSAGQSINIFSIATNEARILKPNIPGSARQLIWDREGGNILIKSTDDETGRQGVFKFNENRARTEQLILENLMIGEATLANNRLFFTLQSKASPENIWMLDLKSNKAVKLTAVNRKIEAYTMGRSELIHWKTTSGNPLKGVLLYPADYVPGEDYPVVIWVYESFSGDLHRFIQHYTYNLQILANQGYAVLMPDVAFMTGETARSFKDSILPALDRLVEIGIANGKFGVMGWSYGGFATNMIITQTERFGAAVTICGISDWPSKNSMPGDFWRRGDQIGQGRLGGNLWEAHDSFVRNSPIFFLDKVKTPLMLLHGTVDRNVPFSQAEEMYYSLRDLNKTALLVAYPGETHLGGDAEQWVIEDVWSKILSWFDKYLK